VIALSLRFRRLLLGSAPALAFTVSGCKGCGSEKPYTPFGVASSLPSVATSAGPPPSSSAPPPAFAEKKAVSTPKRATQITLGERDLESPPGRVFDQVLTADLDGDGRDDAAAFTLPAPGAAQDAAPGEVHFYTAEAEPQKLLDWPTFLPSGPSCNPSATIVQRSARALTIDLQVACTTQLVARAPTRALVLLDLGASRPFKFGVRAADSAPGETLVVDLAARDADGDGRDDPALRVGVTSKGGEPPLWLEFTWFDRAAGASRDARQPSRALSAELDADGIRAVRKKSAAHALSRVESARRALFSACAEGGTPRVFDWDGAALPCEPTPELIDRLGSIDVTARLTQGDLVGAIGALSRDGWYFGAVRPKKRVALLAELEKRLPPIPVSTLSLALPLKDAPRPHYSPLWFEADGALSIQTTGGVSRVPANGDHPLPADPGAGDLGWPLEVASAGERLSGVVYSCDRSELQLLVTGTTTRLLPTAELAPRPGVCRGARLDDPLAVAPIAFGPAGVELFAAGARIQTGGATQRPPRGSARSENGARFAFASGLGLVIGGGEKAELWKVDGWAATPGSDCVVSNDGRRAACVRAGRVELYTR
jgi:hypothetical protein